MENVQEVLSLQCDFQSAAGIDNSLLFVVFFPVQCNIGKTNDVALYPSGQFAQHIRLWLFSSSSHNSLEY